MKPLPVDLQRPQFECWLGALRQSLGPRIDDEEWAFEQGLNCALFTPYSSQRAVLENHSLNESIKAQLRGEGCLVKPILGVWRDGEEWGQEPTNLIFAPKIERDSLREKIQRLALETVQDAWVWAEDSRPAELLWTQPALAPADGASESFSTFNPRVTGSYNASLLRARPSEIKDPRWRRIARERCAASPDPEHHYFWIDTRP